MEYYVYNLLTLVAIYVILGVSFNLLLGYSGLFSMAHAAFFGIGAYVTAVLTKNLHFDFLAAMLIGMGVSVLFSLLLGFASLRVSGEYLVIGSLAFQVLVVEVVNNLKITGRSMGIVGIPRPTLLHIPLTTPLAVLLLTWCLAIAVSAVAHRLVHSPVGRVLASIREDETAARSLGKHTLHMKVYIFALTSGLAAVAGAVFAGYVRFISPAEFTVERSITILSLTIIGGLAAFWGPYVGAAITVLIPQVLTFVQLPHSIAASINAVVYSALVLVLLLFRPEGIMGRKGGRRKGAAGRADEAGPAAPAPTQSSQSAATVIEFPRRHRARGRDNDPAPILAAEGLTKSFGGLVAVGGLTMGLRRQRITGLVGPNGAGKTTIFNLLSGYLAPDTGRVLFDGTDVSRLPPEQRAVRGLVRSFQEMRLFGRMTVMDNVLTALTPVACEGITVQFARTGARRAEELLRVDQGGEILAYLGLYSSRTTLAADLSYAEQKLLMMGRLLATGAECYLLDEPMSGLDHGARNRMCRILGQAVDGGKTICLIEHNLDVIREVCGHVLFLDQGTLIAEGKPEEIMGNQELTNLYFGA